MAKDPTEWDDLLFPRERVPATHQKLFGYEGHVYLIHLNDENAERYRRDMQRYVKAALATGQKMDSIPKALKLEFPPPTLNLPDGDTHPERNPADPRKTWATVHDRSLPSGGEAPEDFWVTRPKDAPFPAREEFKAFRHQIYRDMGLPIRNGNLPRATGYGWAKTHEAELWLWIRAHPDRYPGVHVPPGVDA